MNLKQTAILANGCGRFILRATHARRTRRPLDWAVLKRGYWTVSAIWAVTGLTPVPVPVTVRV